MQNTSHIRSTDVPRERLDSCAAILKIFILLQSPDCVPPSDVRLQTSVCRIDLTLFAGKVAFARATLEAPGPPWKQPNHCNTHSSHLRSKVKSFVKLKMFTAPRSLAKSSDGWLGLQFARAAKTS